jgi:hypothetical protein
MTLDELHQRLRRKVTAIFAGEVMTEEDRTWRRAVLVEAYTDFGVRADRVRNIEPRTAA